jgi:hypothetical protein
MSIFISHSQIYGTEDWFHGDPSTYEITEERAFCLPAGLITRNTFDISDAEVIVPQEDDNFRVGNLTGLGTLQQIQYLTIATSYFKVVSDDQYVYFKDAGAPLRVNQFEIATGNTVYLELETDNIYVVGLHSKNIVLCSSWNWTNQNLEIHKLDFSGMTVALVCEFPEPAGYYWAGGSIPMTTVVYNGNLYTIIIHDITQTSSPYSTLKTGFLIYDWTNETTLTEFVDLPQVTSITWVNKYISPLFINNKLYLFGSPRWTSYVAGVYAYAVWYDFQSGTTGMATIAGSSNACELTDMGLYKSRNEAYFTMVQAADGAYDNLIKFDLGTGTFSVADSSSWRYYLYPKVYNDEKCWEIHQTTGAIVDIYTRETYRTVPTLASGDRMHPRLDRSNRLWYYRNNRLENYEIASGSTESGIIDLGFSTGTCTIAIHGEKMIIYKGISSPRSRTLYVLTPEVS